MQRSLGLNGHATTMTRLRQLARRFFGSLRPGGPSVAEQQWAESKLLPGEQAIWRSLSSPDRRHSAGVARRVEVTLGPAATRSVLAAALLHDCGKAESGLRTPGRVLATVLAMTAMKTDADVERWCQSKLSWKRTVGRYRRHPAIGAQMLSEVGSDAVTVTWTREHHLPRSDWTTDPIISAALHEADDD